MIYNAVVAGWGGGGSNYTKVKATSGDYAQSHFVYRPPDGGGKYPIEVKGDLAETPCQPGSVAIMGVTSKSVVPVGNAFVTEVKLDGDTLVLTVTLMAISDGNIQTEIT